MNRQAKQAKLPPTARAGGGDGEPVEVVRINAIPRREMLQQRQTRTR